MNQCSNCNSFEHDKAQPVPFAAHEMDMARMERANERLSLTNKRMWALTLILFILFLGTNAAWLYRESQMEVIETTTTEIEQETDGGGNNYVIGGDYNGEAKSENNQDKNTNP